MLLVFEATAAEEPPPMLTQGDDGEVHALHRRGWSILAIGALIAARAVPEAAQQIA